MKKAVGPDEALELVLAHTRELTPRLVPLDEALGLVLAEPVLSDRDYPPFDRAAMDGVAVCMADQGGRVQVTGEAAAGHAATGAVSRGIAVEVMTGAAVPSGTEAVVPREDLVREGAQALLPPSIRAGQHVALAGSECRAGAAVLEAGDVLGSLGVASAASFGLDAVLVVPRPRVAVVVTGDEIVPPGLEPGRGQIRDSNGAMLTALAREADADLDPVVFAGDSEHSLRDALGQAAGDVLLVTGGVSAGKYDLVPGVLEGLGFELVFHKVTQKPGKPLLFGHRDGKLAFGLPGNPLSAHLGFCRYAAAALARMRRRPLPPPARGRLTAELSSRGERTSFVLAHARPADGGWEVTPLVGRGSADIFASARANAYLRLEPGEQRLAAGSEVELSWSGRGGVG